MMQIKHFASNFVCRQTSTGPEFLQVLRSDDDYMGGTWQLVNGKIEPGETAVQAAVRELHEETALRPLEFYQVNRVNVFYLALNDSIYQVPMFCAIVHPTAQLTLNAEHSDFRWLDRNGFAGQLMWPGERDGFVEICREILDDGPAKKHLRIELP